MLRFQLQLGKKSLMRTLEMTLAVVITFMFLMYAVPQLNTSKVEEQPNILETLMYNPNFRNAVISNNNTLVRSLIQERFHSVARNYNFSILITNNTDAYLVLNHKRVFSEFLFISGNETNKVFKIIRLYYWRKE